MPSAPQAFPIDFGRYRLLRKLAKGGMAELFLATRPGAKEPLVIKRVLPHFCSDPEFLTMFLNEARIAAQLDHPNIVGVYDLGQQGEHIYIAMEYIDGSDLEHLAKECGGTIPPHLAARIGVSICEALYYANRSPDLSTGKPLNVIHRDVTPGNVMITRAGVVKLVDFGVAKATAQLERTRPGVVKGKFRYMSPEQIQLKELDGRSDLFSLGVLLYEITTGKKPFDRSQVIDIIRALSGWDPPPPADFVAGYPRALSDVIMAALRKDPDQRYRDGREMGRALEAALQKMPPAGSTELGEFVTRYLDPPAESDDQLPPWEEGPTDPSLRANSSSADGRTDPSASYPNRRDTGKAAPPHSSRRDPLDARTDPSASYPAPPDDEEQGRTDEMTRLDGRSPLRERPAEPQPRQPAPRTPTSQMRAAARTSPPPGRPTRADGPLAPPVPGAQPATVPVPPLAPPVNSNFDDDEEEKTTLEQGPFYGMGAAGPGSRPQPARRSGGFGPSLEDQLGDDGPSTITNRDPPRREAARGPRQPQPPAAAAPVEAEAPRRRRPALLVILALVLVCIAGLAGWLLLSTPAPVPAPVPTEPETEAGSEKAAAPAAHPAAALGKLTFDSPPKSVYEVDDRHRCTAPCTLELPAGQHTVRLGHLRRSVEVAAGEVTHFSL